MKQYKNPKMEISYFNGEDIVTSSDVKPKGMTAAEQGNGALFGEFGTGMVKTVKISDVMLVY